MLSDFSHKSVKKDRDGSWGLILVCPVRPRGDNSRFRLLRGIEKLVLCKCTSKTVSHVFVRVSPSPPSLTCKWQKDSVATPDTCPLCFSEGLDNCYGNCMSRRWVDWLIQAVGQTDESFEHSCLFRSALVVMLWPRVRRWSPVMDHV